MPYFFHFNNFKQKILCIILQQNYKINDCHYKDSTIQVLLTKYEYNGGIIRILA